MLQVDLQRLAHGPVETVGELAGTDPLLAGLGFAWAGPVQVRGRVQAAGEGRYYWHGRVRGAVAAECRRCLAALEAPVEAEIGALFASTAEAADDPECYPIAPGATAIDLGPAIREELALAAPAYALCREDCRGLCPRCGHDLNTGPCGCSPATETARPFATLKGKLHP